MMTTVQMIIDENREYLNREFQEVKRLAAVRKESADRASSADFKNFVTEFLSSKKFNKTHQTASARHILAINAAKYASRMAFIVADRAFVRSQKTLGARHMGII